MNNIDFKMHKNLRDGWQADSAIMIDGLMIEGLPAQLRINTSKRSNGLLTTNARVVALDTHSYSHRVFTDFNHSLFHSRVRVTEEAVSIQHAKQLLKLPAVLESIKAHYINIDNN